MSEAFRLPPALAQCPDAAMLTIAGQGGRGLCSACPTPTSAAALLLRASAAGAGASGSGAGSTAPGGASKRQTPPAWPWSLDGFARACTYYACGWVHEMWLDPREHTTAWAASSRLDWMAAPLHSVRTLHACACGCAQPRLAMRGAARPQAARQLRRQRRRASSPASTTHHGRTPAAGAPGHARRTTRGSPLQGRAARGGRPRCLCCSRRARPPAAHGSCARRTRARRRGRRTRPAACQWGRAAC